MALSVPGLAAPATCAAEFHRRLKRRIDAELEVRLAEWFPGLPHAHLNTLRQVLADGKRLRGSLACLVAEALGGRADDALPAALAVEIIQAASLVHDDFVDGDVARRGRAAAWTILSPRRAVLLADVMFATAIEKMADAGGRESATLARAIATMAQGAFQETLAPGRDSEAYNRIIYLKTGSLFAAAARLGALAADAGSPQVEAASDFGALAGKVYQIADDLADLRRLDSSNCVAPAQLQALAPALLYFTGNLQLAGSVPLLRDRMEDEIRLLIGRASDSLGPFPECDATRMLGELPALLAAMAS